MNIILVILVILLLLYFISSLNNNIENFTPTIVEPTQSQTQSCSGYLKSGVYTVNSDNCDSKSCSGYLKSGTWPNQQLYCNNKGDVNTMCDKNINCNDGLICSRLNGDSFPAEMFMMSGGDPKYCLKKPNNCRYKGARDDSCIIGERCNDNNHCVSK